MLKHHSAVPLVKAACIVALAVAPTCLHADSFAQINLVSNVPGLAAVTDPNLVNPWGVSFSATSPFWVSNQGSGTATLYNGLGTPNAIVVSIPAGANPPSGPTGQVFNASPAGQFLVGATKASFIFDTLNGTIAAWNGGTTATVEATTPGAIYTGLAQATVGANTFIYAANSAPGGGINVFNSLWQPTTVPGGFIDHTIPAGYVPFNIQQVGTNLYVTYAELGPTGNAVPGSTGYVDVFDANGNFLQRVASGGLLSAPWGVTIAPPEFGAYSNDLLIGQFGSGEILAYDPTTDAFLGALDGSNGQPIVDHNLWAIVTRTGGTGDNLNALYLTAGINNQTNGLFAEIVDVPEPVTIIETASGLFALAMLKFRSRRR
jgi:uncharacterized protein (TIGR03118 family)